MTKKRVAKATSDAGLGKTPITIDSKKYSLCFDFDAMAAAEIKLNMELSAAGSEERVNLLIALAELNLSSVPVLFAAALKTFHPEIGFDAARALVRADNLYIVASTIQHAWGAAQPEPAKNPPAAQAS